ncbi:MAG: DUF1566 domain-containing protein [Myxococcota bacterium]
MRGAARILLTVLVVASAAVAGAFAPTGRYVVSEAEVLDTRTGLTWQRGTSAAGLTWQEARAYCQSPWRLPSARELASLVDVTTAWPAIDTDAFPDTPVEDYWTATPCAFNPGSAWYVEFRWGQVYNNLYESHYWARCVR